MKASQKLYRTTKLYIKHRIDFHFWNHENTPVFYKTLQTCLSGENDNTVNLQSTALIFGKIHVLRFSAKVICGYNSDCLQQVLWFTFNVPQLKTKTDMC